MKTADFLRKHDACHEDAEWALSISDEMSAVWDALVKQGKHEWLLWTVTRPGVFPDSTLRKLACRFVRETPIGGGRTVWDVLEDDRSRRAIEVAAAYADGKATKAELSAAYAAACAAAAARAAARADAYDAAYAAASYDAEAALAADAAAYADDAAAAVYAAADAVARADAYDDHVRMIAELGNPFKEELARD